MDSTNRVRESAAERTQKKQKAWILSSITPNSTPLKTAIPRDTVNSPHQVRRDKSPLFSCSPGNRGSSAISSTAP